MADWKIPLPEVEENEYVWKPLVRISKIIPWGYEQDPNDPDILLPIPEQLIVLEQAKEHLKKYSYRDVAAWLSQETGASISHVGLYNRVKSEHKRKTKASQLYYLARRYREAWEKAKKIEEQSTGYKVRESDYPNLCVCTCETCRSNNGRDSGKN